MKAYIVTYDGSEPFWGVYFANKPSQAKKQALTDIYCDYIDLECRREPSLDKFSPGPIFIKDLIENGWYFNCFECETQIDEDGYYNEEEGRYTEPIYIDNDSLYNGAKGEIYCCQECLDNKNQRIEETKANKEKAINIIKSRFPEAKIVFCAGSPNRYPTYVDFSLPFSPRSIGWNTIDKEYLVPQCDVENFNKYVKSINKSFIK